MGDDQKTIWCGNLSEKVTEPLLYELFLQAGPLQRVTIPKDRDGRQRSYAFITYKDECSVPYAVSLFEDTRLFNRTITLSAKGGNVADNSDRGRNELGHGQDQRVVLPASPWAANKVAAPFDFDSLLQFGQQMMAPAMNLVGSPFMQLPNMMGLPMYASQMGGQNYLGGAVNLKDGNYGHENPRNHPYATPGKGSPGSGYGHNGYRNNRKSNDYYQRSDRN